MEINKEKIKKYDTQIAIIAAYIQEMEDRCSRNELDFEERVLFNRLILIKDEMEKYLDRVKYFDGKIYEGTLKINENGKFYFDYIHADGYKEKKIFSCGSRIELYLYNEYEEEWKWYLGSVESSNEKYMFTGSNKPYLEEGMKVRYRE